jgi:hypothetical protein
MNNSKLITLQRKLQAAPSSPPRPLTEERMRQIAREEASKATARLRLSSASVRRGGCG